MKYNELLKDSQYGIFYHIQQTHALNWFTETMSRDLDLEYLYNQSGEKTVTLLAEKCDLSQVASIIVNKFGDNWNRLYDAFVQSTYNPIENYAMQETETPDLISTSTQSKTHIGSSKDTTTGSGQMGSTGENKQSSNITTKNDSKTGVYGFNSSSSTPSNTGEGTQTTVGGLEDNKVVSSNTNTSSTSEETSGSVNESDTSTDSTTHKGTRTLTRSGNIGVTTSQQMLQSEIDLRKWNLYDRMFKDVDSVLVYELYE